jgi:hypothetical protein
MEPEKSPLFVLTRPKQAEGGLFQPRSSVINLKRAKRGILLTFKKKFYNEK